MIIELIQMGMLLIVGVCYVLGMSYFHGPVRKKDRDQYGLVMGYAGAFLATFMFFMGWAK